MLLVLLMIVQMYSLQNCNKQRCLYLLLFTVVVLYSAEGSVWGGREGQDSLTAGAFLGESKQPPEGKGEDHETSATPGPACHNKRAADPQLQTTLWAKDTPDSPWSGHYSGPEEPTLKKGPLQEAKKIEFSLFMLYVNQILLLLSINNRANWKDCVWKSERRDGNSSRGPHDGH